MALQFFCAICQKEYGSSDELATIRCGQVFHHRCLLEWFDRSDTCPDCRSAASSGDLKKIYITSKTNESEEPKEEILKDVNENMKPDSKLVESVVNSSTKDMLDEAEKNNSELQKQLDIVHGEREDLLREKQRLQSLNGRLKSQLESKTIENRKIRKEFEKTKNTDNTREQLAEKGRVIEELQRQLALSRAELSKELLNSDRLYEEKVILKRLFETSTRCPKFPVTEHNPKPKNRCDQNPNDNKAELNGANNQASGNQLHVRLGKKLYYLFQYAKRLERYGFQRVFYEGNEIFATRNNNEIKISSRDQVDDLMDMYQEERGNRRDNRA